ncbi:MAG: hypothetical protein ABEK10_05105 [Candidatus Nanosalina sp.]
MEQGKRAKIGDFLIILGTVLFTAGQVTNFAPQFDRVEDHKFHQAIFLELKADRYCEKAPPRSTLDNSTEERIIKLYYGNLSSKELMKRDYQSSVVENSVLCLEFSNKSNTWQNLAMNVRENAQKASNSAVPNSLVIILLWVGIVLRGSSLLERILLSDNEEE